MIKLKKSAPPIGRALTNEKENCVLPVYTMFFAKKRFIIFRRGDIEKRE